MDCPRLLFDPGRGHLQASDRTLPRSARQGVAAPPSIRFTGGRYAAAWAARYSPSLTFTASSEAGVKPVKGEEAFEPLSPVQGRSQKEALCLLRFALCSTPCLSPSSRAHQSRASRIDSGCPGIGKHSWTASRRTSRQTLTAHDSPRPTVWPLTRSSRSPSKYNPVHRVKNYRR